jgi:phosphoserine phosphatase
MSKHINISPQNDVPLCVDLDGTLIQTDLLLESWLALLKRNVLLGVLAPLWLIYGKCRLKHEIAQRIDVEVCHLPYNTALLDRLCELRKQGRRLILATATNEKYANQVAEHLGIFEAVVASNAHANVSGEAKRQLLSQRFGERGFDYIGNARSDLLVFPGARRAILVNPEPGVERAVKKARGVVESFTAPSSAMRVYLGALRPHQWLKNLLLFVPLTAGHRLGFAFVRRVPI